MAWYRIGGCALSLVAWHAAVEAQVALKDSARNPQAATEAKAPHQTPPLERRVSLDLQNVTLRSALHEIDRQARLGLAFTPLIVPLDRRVTFQADSVTVGDALERVLRGTGVKAVVTTSETVMLVRQADLRSDGPAADTGGVALVLVHVTDDTTTKPLVGAVVGIEGTQNQDKTTETGYTALRRVPAGVAIVYVHYLGYTPVEQRVVVPDTGYVTVNVPMKMGMAHLQEVVTTATGPRRRYELGNDITILNVDSIAATQPVSNVTDILVGRVPGLTVQHTSGAPGDPARLRLRGASSMLESNDPIVMVDGIRINYNQSDSLSANRAGGRVPGTSNADGLPFAKPSPLDEIDPASIETIEVLKGPSAATLYGPDAANGVIVVTTKKGRPGPARWTVSEERGISNTPGSFPVGYYRWGTDDVNGLPVLCPLTAFTCRADSLVRFQALNNPNYTVIRPGATGSTSVDVSGGSDKLTYFLSGSLRDASGIVGLPPVEIAHFQSVHDGADPPSWMSHPQHLTQWQATTTLHATLSDRADASVSVSFDQTTQQRSTLEREVGSLLATYIDPKTHTYWQASDGSINTVPDLLPDMYHRVTADMTNFTNGANLNWRPLNWLSANARAGINVVSSQTDDLLPSGMLLGGADSAGSLSTDRETQVATTLSVGGSARIPVPFGIQLTLGSGIDLTKQSVGDLGAGALGLAPGTSSLVGAQQLLLASQASTDVTSYGWYLAPDITIGHHLAINPGLRFDQSSSFGKNAHQPLFPKINVSWLASEEKFFPFKKIFDTFRPRGSYGESGVWPGPADQLRLYASSEPFLDGAFQPATQIVQLGNTQLRPERGTEFELGFDADLFHDLMSVTFTAYRKMRYDAIESVPVAPSVYGTAANIRENIGDVRNTGLEGTLSTQLLRTDLVSWGMNLNVTSLHSLVTRLGTGVVPFGTSDSRVVARYPLFSRWSRPILGYTDANHDGIIEPDEVLVGDSLVYMGSSEPNYTAGLGTSFIFFRGAVAVSANFTYEAGLTQLNSTILNSGGNGGASFAPGAGNLNGGLIFARGASDPHAPLSEQAGIAALGETDYALYQTVNALRLESVSVNFQMPSKIAHWLVRATSMSVALQGSNLALFTNYKGKDPDVNQFATGNALSDNGVVPRPRVWQITVRANY